MKHQTKQQKFNDLANAVTQINNGQKVKRVGAKDGSVPSGPPIVKVDSSKLEAEVLKDCMKWLRSHHIMCNRHDVGSFQNQRGMWGTYGIKGAGDIIGIIGPHGTHFEIECKRGKGGKLSMEQQQRMMKVKNNHGLYFIVHGVEELRYYFEDLL